MRPAPLLPVLCAQLRTAAAGASSSSPAEIPPPWPANPFPKGIRPGSVTDKVRAVTLSAHPKWFEHNELMRLCGGSRGAIAWAVRYLQHHGLLRSIESVKRPGYRRYQAVSVTTEGVSE